MRSVSFLGKFTPGSRISASCSNLLKLSIDWCFDNLNSSHHQRQHLTLMMTSTQVVETSVNVITDSPSQDYTHPDNHTLPTYGNSYSCMAGTVTNNRFFTKYEEENYCQVKVLVKEVDIPVLEIKKKISCCPYAKCRATKPLNLVALKIDRPWQVWVVT